MKNRSSSDNKFPKRKASSTSKFPGRAVDDDKSFDSKKSFSSRDRHGDGSSSRYPRKEEKRTGERSFNERPKEHGGRFSSDRPANFERGYSSKDHFFRKNDRFSDDSSSREGKFIPRDDRPLPLDDRPRKQFIKKYEERSDRSSHSQGSYKGSNDRFSKSKERPFANDRFPREGSSFKNKRSERPFSSERKERFPREERPFSSERKERFPREERPFSGERKERFPREERPFSGERKERFPREERSFSGERKERFPREERSFSGERKERFPREERPFSGERKERFPREERSFSGERKERFPREERSFSNDRKERLPRERSFEDDEKETENTPRPGQGQFEGEMKYYGFHACMQLWKSRPDDVIRVYVEERQVQHIAPLLKWCAAQKKAYHVVTSEDLEKVAGSIHHEGLCILAKELENVNFDELLNTLNNSSETSTCLLYLDGVQNPHNIGSIMRVCAHFGVNYILGDQSSLPKVSPSAYRVAQGGAEAVKLVPLENSKEALAQLKAAGFSLIASSSHGNHSLYSYQFPNRTLLLMGSEGEGINKKLLESATETLSIPGTNKVESLNVSVATGLFLGEYWRQVQAK